MGGCFDTNGVPACGRHAAECVCKDVTLPELAENRLKRPGHVAHVVDIAACRPGRRGNRETSIQTRITIWTNRLSVETYMKQPVRPLSQSSEKIAVQNRAVPRRGKTEANDQMA